MPVTTDAFNGSQIAQDALAPGTVTTTWEKRHEAHRERLARVEARAEAIEPGRAAKTVIAGIIVAAAWLAGKACRVLFRAAAFGVACAQVGWADGTGRGPTKGALAEENARLRAELARWSGDEHAAAVIGASRR